LRKGEKEIKDSRISSFRHEDSGSEKNKDNLQPIGMDAGQLEVASEVGGDIDYNTSNYPGGTQGEKTKIALAKKSRQKEGR